MYCGSCLRDNALATELIRRGHDVMLLPMYTPTLTDERNVSSSKVFFGGISVYLEQYVPFFRRSPAWLDRLLDSQLLLKWAARRSIKTDPQMLGEMTVSMLKGENGHQRKELAKLVEWLKTEDRPDVINLPYTLLISLAKPLKEALRRPILCTLQGEDLFLDNLREPYRSESFRLIREQVAHVDAFLPVSDYYARFMPGYLGIPAEKMRVVPLGINTEGYEPRVRDESQPFTVGFFARVAPEKGLHVLAESYKILRESGRLQNARLEVAGYMGAEHREYFAEVEAKMRAWGLSDEFNYRGTLDREQKIDFLRTLDVLSVPATYDEPKGIFLLEAMACGVPVVQPRRGAFTEVVERAQGGLLVEPDGPASLAEGIMQIHDDNALALELGQRGARGVREHYTVGRMAERAVEVYEGVLKAERQSEGNMAHAGAMM